MFDPSIVRYQIRDALVYWLLIPAFVVLGGKVIDVLSGLPTLPRPGPVIAVAVLLLGCGLLLIFFSMRDFKRAGGTPNPLRPPRRLVTTGSYALCRHPMFLGYDLCALAVVLALASPGMLFFTFPVFILLQVRFLHREEHILLLKFKEAYGQYRATTSFLLPFSRVKDIFRRQAM